jgi:hypothetical protein
MAQAVSRRPLTALSPGFAPGSIHVGFVVYKVGLGQFFSEFPRLKRDINPRSQRPSDQGLRLRPRCGSYIMFPYNLPLKVDFGGRRYLQDPFHIVRMKRIVFYVRYLATVVHP